MNNIHTKQTETENTFISVRKTIDFIFESLSKDIDKQTKISHVLNSMNQRFFKNQTCLVKDGYSLENIKIDKESHPSYQDFKNAIASHLTGKKSPLLDEYGFSKKRTLDNLQMMGVNIPHEMILMAKSFIPNDDCFNDEMNYRDFLPSEYMLLVKENERLKLELLEPSDLATNALHARIAELEKQLRDKAKSDDKELDQRTENNLIRLLLVVNEWAKTNKDKDRNLLDTSKSYNTSDLEKINSTLDLLGYHQIGETAYKTLINLIKSKKSKGL